MDPSTALAVVSLSFDLFVNCVKGFALITDARNIEKDAAIERTKLVLQECRLIEWARALGLGSPKDDASPKPNQHAAAVVLSQLEQLLSSTEALKKRYKLELVSMQDEKNELVPAETTVTSGNPTSSILPNIVSSETRQAILDRSSKVSTANRFPKRLWWAAVDKKKYAELVRDVASLVDGLWSLLDVSHRLQTSRAVNQTLQLAIQTSKDIAGLQDLQKSLHDSATNADMSNSLAASAGLKARLISLASCDEDARHLNFINGNNSIALLSFHTAGWLHKGVRSENILLVSPQSTQSTGHLGRPYLCGFSFARQGSPTEISEQPSTNPLRDIYRHAKALGDPSESFERYMDVYSLGCVLIEIAEWTPLRKIVKKRIDTSGSIDVKLSDIAVLSQWMHGRYITEGNAAFRLGTAFMKMLALCIPAGYEKPDLADFYSALEGMAASNI
ncbi:hypothetical protein FSST1_009893 [Fusarium sambucinum]